MLTIKKFFTFLSFVLLMFSLTLTAFAEETDVEVAVTVFNSEGEAFGEVTVYIYTLNEDTGDYQESIGYMTNSSTLTNNIAITLGSTFYAKAYDADGNVYQYAEDPDVDNNIWTILNANLIENVDTDETRIPYVELYPTGETIAVATSEEEETEERENAEHG